MTHIMNQPASEFENTEQLCWSFQNAHWFYMDELCSQNPALPKYSFPEFLKLLVAVVPGLEHLQSDVPVRRCPDIVHLSQLYFFFSFKLFSGMVVDATLTHVL